MPAKTRIKKRQRRGAPWTDEEDARLLAIAGLPPRVVADLMQRTWLTCRRRLAYLPWRRQRTYRRADRAIVEGSVILGPPAAGPTHKESGATPLSLLPFAAVQLTPATS